MSKLFWTLVWGPVLRMDTGDDVIFLRPLVSALSQDVKLWRVREQSREGGREGGLEPSSMIYLTFQSWNSWPDPH